MSIINVSNYTKYKEVDFVDQNGKKQTLKIRPMSSAESLDLGSLNEEMEELKAQGRANEAPKLLKKVSDTYFGLYDDPEKAKKILGGLSFDAWFDIYKRVMENDYDG